MFFELFIIAVFVWYQIMIPVYIMLDVFRSYRSFLFLLLLNCVGWATGMASLL